MALFLVQHGKSLPRDEDPEKGLSDPGRADTARIAEVAKSYRIHVARIVHSNKKRAAQTAAVFNDVLGLSVPVEKMDGISPMDDVIAFAAGIDPESNVMVVGHLPFMERLVSYLTAGTADIRVLKFQNSGIVCLDRDREGRWSIQWTLNPNIS